MIVYEKFEGGKKVVSAMGCFKSQTTSTEGMQLETFHKENFISTAIK